MSAAGGAPSAVIILTRCALAAECAVFAGPQTLSVGASFPSVRVDHVKNVSIWRAAVKPKAHSSRNRWASQNETFS